MNSNHDITQRQAAERKQNDVQMAQIRASELAQNKSLRAEAYKLAMGIVGQKPPQAAVIGNEISISDAVMEEARKIYGFFATE